jgi:uncharacterized protein (DUF488 family)
MSPPRIHSIGHSTHELTAFVALLRRHAVERVVDVRAHPGSRRLPWFNREALAAELPHHGLVYAHVPELGGRRRPAPDTVNRGWRVEAFRGYADHMAGEEFAAGLAALQALARERPTAVMCAEAVWWRCHRRLIADALTVRGWDVVHIGADGATTAHELPAFAVADGARLTYPPAQSSLDETG